jgi:tripartite-type tricarboxylate transporter receptor subunit TctC
VIANRVTMTFAAGGAADARSGVLTPLGFSSLTRLAAFPDIPTIAEQDLPNYSDYVWFAMFAPAKTPRDAIMRLSDAMQRSTREFRERIEKDGNELTPMSPDEFNEFVKRETVEMGKLIAQMGLKKKD